MSDTSAKLTPLEIAYQLLATTSAGSIRDLAAAYVAQYGTPSEPGWWRCSHAGCSAAVLAPVCDTYEHVGPEHVWWTHDEGAPWCPVHSGLHWRAAQYPGSRMGASGYRSPLERLLVPYDDTWLQWDAEAQDFVRMRSVVTTTVGDDKEPR